MTDHQELFDRLSEVLDKVPERESGERLVIVIGGTAHMSKSMREQLFNGLNRPGVCVMTPDQYKGSEGARERKHADSLRDLEALMPMRQFDMPVKLDRMRQGKGERKRSRRNRYFSGSL